MENVISLKPPPIIANTQNGRVTTTWRVFTLLFFLFFLPSYAFCQAPTLKEILPNDKCSNSIDDIIASFRHPSGEANKVAIQLLEAIRDVKPSEASLTRLLNDKINPVCKDKPKHEDFENSLKYLIKELPNTETELKNLKQDIACKVAQFLHQSYLDNPSLLKGLPKMAVFYRGKTVEPTPPIVDGSLNTKRNGSVLSDQEATRKVRNPPTSKRGSSGLGIIGYLFLCLIIVGILFFWIKFRRKARSNEKAETDVSKSNTGDRVTEEEDKEQYEKEIEELKRKLEKANVEIQDLKSELIFFKRRGGGNTANETLWSNFAPNNNSGKEASIANSSPGIPIPSFYSPAPTKEGVFFGEELSKFEDSESIYQIFVDNRDSKKAEFWLLDNREVILKVAAYAGSYLSPACILKGPESISIKDANQLDILPGILIKEGNNWRVEKKAEINWT